ncbi:MAG: phosphonate metabolism protein PhnP [Pseudomonadota bacterium]|uniref:phosphonate metabolism protein PhnP n=1 Tax=Limnobacter alexandrii TaxID=2570352 RepID=UPI001107A7E6|nr:phosphonate metabolism protein PhnP [Limnobacter alexandrii]
MRITYLGTGAAGGVPRYGCNCPACERAQNNRVFVRRPCSALIEHGDTRVVLDAGLMNLHDRFPLGSFNAIVLTHFHPDHVQGLFHLRWGVSGSVPVYCPPDSEGCADLFKHPGILEFKPQSKFDTFQVGSLTFTPLPLIHSKVTFGYLIESNEGARFAYLTDTVGLPPKTIEHLQQCLLHGMAIDATDPPPVNAEAPAGNHNHWDQALALIDQIKPVRAWLTHLNHRSDTWQMLNNPTLPQGVHVACDNAIIELQA